MTCKPAVLIGIVVLIFSCAAQSMPGGQASLESAGNRKADTDKPLDAAKVRNPVLWHDPGTIASLNLYDGQGGKQGMPGAPFKFESENLQGSNPKFDVLDAKGTKWRVKLGEEVRPEVVASRLLWAVGYFVNDDYVIASPRVEGLHLARGEKLTKDGQIEEARFEKKADHQQKIGTWRWKNNPFTGTRELNGLRVMMAVMNNWDLKDENNAVYSDESSDRDIFLASDIGATFGTNGLSWNEDRSKGDVATFQKSKFITRQTSDEIDFATPAAPMPLEAVNAKQFQMRLGLKWIGQGIPTSDARWIGSLLKQLSHQQLVDAFRAGHFPPDEIDKYVEVVEQRIQELAAL